MTADVNIVRHVLMDKGKARIDEQVGHVVHIARNEVVQTHHLIPVGQEALTQMRADKPGPSSD